ncbi:MAG: imidazoleglycerol-phosphate dehydratase HisB [Melioribacteraceae bacterium]|nr:imidazoleglycerol-phosphate dehydratase HisB [Melioribacteraceae bacterium]
MKLKIDEKYFLEVQKIQNEFISSLKRLCENDFELYSTISEKKLSICIKSVLESEGIEVKFGVLLEKYDDKIIYKTDANYFNERCKLILRRKRIVKHSRITKETNIKLELDLDGEGKTKIKTGNGFFDHMLEQFARHSFIDTKINAIGDLIVDEHHLVEDVGLALGEAILKVLGDKKGISRFGFIVPMDDSLTDFAVDLSGRPYLAFDASFNREMVGQFPTELAKEFFRAVSVGLKANIHIKAKGENDHHKIESMFKAFGRAINSAVSISEKNKNILPTTKGVL